MLGVHGGALRVSVRASPERGKANKAVVELLAEVFQVAAGDVRILSGATTQSKKVCVPLDPSSVAERVKRVLS